MENKEIIYDYIEDFLDRYFNDYNYQIMNDYKEENIKNQAQLYDWINDNDIIEYIDSYPFLEEVILNSTGKDFEEKAFNGDSFFDYINENQEHKKNEFYLKIVSIIFDKVSQNYDKLVKSINLYLERYFDDILDKHFITNFQGQSEFNYQQKIKHMLKQYNWMDDMDVIDYINNDDLEYGRYVIINNLSGHKEKKEEEWFYNGLIDIIEEKLMEMIS